MKVIKYKMLQGDDVCDVSIDYNESNLAIAEKEAFNGEYTIEDNGEPEPEIVVSTEDILNAMLGVN